MERGTTLHVPELGIVTSTPQSRSARGRGGPKAATALMLLPHTGNLSGAYRDYQHRRRSFTIGNYCRLARERPRVF